MEGYSCKRLGEEKVNGRSTVKWLLTEKGNEKEPLTYWVDKALGLPVKWEAGGTTTEMRNIKEGPQPASLFEVPKGYQVRSMPAMPGGALPATTDED